MSPATNTRSELTQESRDYVVNQLFQIVLNQSEASRIEKLIYDVCDQLSKEESCNIKNKYVSYGYQKIGEIISYPTKIKEIINDLEKYIFDWESSIFEDYRQKEHSDINKQIVGITVKVGVFVCQKKECSSKKCFYSQVQSRSNDEGFTTNVICTECGTRFTFN